MNSAPPNVPAREWWGGLLAIGAVIGLWIAVLGGVAEPLGAWISRGGVLHWTAAHAAQNAPALQAEGTAIALCPCSALP